MQQNGRTLKNMRMFDSDELLDDYKALNAKIRDYGTPTILQLTTLEI